jgi:hypothetical protein
MLGLNFEQQCYVLLVAREDVTLLEMCRLYDLARDLFAAGWWS